MNLVVYSLVVSAISPVKKLIGYHKKLDPLNELRLRNVLLFAYYFCQGYPLLLMWDLYEKYTPLKIVLLIY